ncbi:MAG: prepilin-type N-terminal cleavage/methylation domain-containing protein [Candidatus Omnitrophota bacterium]
MKQRKAFSLIEMIMVMVILGIIAGIGAPLIAETGRGWLLHVQRKEMSESARIAIDRMTREIRRIKDTTSVITASNTAFQFVNIDDENITFDSSGTTLRRTIDGTTNELADNLDSISFTYYDTSGSTITTPDVSPQETDIRRIEISLTFSLGGTQLTVVSQVWPRRFL